MEWPVAGVVTLEFGESDWPYQPFHTGIDLPTRKARLAIRLFLLWQKQLLMQEKLFWGYGKYIQIDNGNNISSIYGHLSKSMFIPEKK